MLAAVFNEIKNIVLEDYTLSSLKKDEVLIKVEYCGVCGTDRHIYEGTAQSKIPIILGHEFSGVIVDANGIEGLNADDKVVIDPNIHCGYCSFCKKGKVNFCENLKALGITLNGGFAEYSIVPVSQIYLVPNDFNLSKAAFAEPVSCCLRGMKHAKIVHGNSVIIIGGGTIGLLMIQLVKMAGAANIVLIEPENDKRKLGIEFGADYAVSPNDDKVFLQIKEITKNQTDVIIECVGKSETVHQAIELSDKGTHIIIFGLAPFNQNINFNLQELFNKEIKISNSYLNPFTFKPAVELLITEKINVQKLITNQILLKNVNDLFQRGFDNRSIKHQIINN